MVICRLYHLQVLHVNRWTNITEIPNDLSNLINLRHFIVSYRYLHSLIASVGTLVNIQELYEFKVRNETEFSIAQLRELKELRKELCIYNLENVKSMEEAKGAGLVDKKFLNKLHLSWNNKNKDVRHSADADVLEGLQTHPNLKELEISGYGGATSVTWLNSLTCLEELNLKACVAWEILPPLGQLPFLRRLCLFSMLAVREIGPNLYGCGQHIPFKCLEVLKLKNLPNLEKWFWDDRCQKLPALWKLSIVDCPGLDILLPSCVPPANFNERFPNLDKLEIVNCAKVIQLSPLPSNEKVTVYIENVRSFEKFNLSASRLYICKPSNRPAWDEVSYHNLRTRTIISLDISSSPYPLSWDNLSNLECLENLSIDDSFVPFSLPNPYNQNYPPLMSLKTLCLNKCDITGKQLTWVLHHVPTLSHLELKKCHELKSIGVVTKMNEQTFTALEVIEPEEDEGLLQIPSSLKSLEELYVSNCPDMVYASKQGLSDITSLQKLDIRNCTRLLCPLDFEQPTSNAYFFPPGLQELTLSNIVSQGTSLLLKGLSSVTKLSICCSPDLKSLDFNSCVALERLYLSYCQKLTSLDGLKSIACMKYLNVQMCPGFTDAWINASEIGFSMALQHLTIDTFEILAVPICVQLTSLQQLTIKGEHAVSMTGEQEEALLLLTSLKVIEFSVCLELRCLPTKLHLLPSLEELQIVYCRNIQSPPENGLPRSLKRLCLDRCGDMVDNLFAQYVPATVEASIIDHLA